MISDYTCVTYMSINKERKQTGNQNSRIKNKTEKKKQRLHKPAHGCISLGGNKRVVRQKRKETYTRPWSTMKSRQNEKSNWKTIGRVENSFSKLQRWSMVQIMGLSLQIWASEGKNMEKWQCKSSLTTNQSEVIEVNDISGLANIKQDSSPFCLCSNMKEDGAKVNADYYKSSYYEKHWFYPCS